MSDTIAVAKLRAYIERVERIETDIAELNADKSEVYKELRGDGFDVKTVRKIVAKRKLDTADRDEQDALFDLYWGALQNGTPRAPAHARGNIEEFSSKVAHDADGVVIEDQPETATISVQPHDEVVRCAPAESASDEISATNSPSASALLPGAEQTGAVNPPPAAPVAHSSLPATVPLQASAPEVIPPLPASGAAISDADVPAFLKKDVVLRPHCLNPGPMCAGSGKQHCWNCRKAMTEGEAA